MQVMVCQCLGTIFPLLSLDHPSTCSHGHSRQTRGHWQQGIVDNGWNWSGGTKTTNPLDGDSKGDWVVVLSQLHHPGVLLPLNRW